MNLTDRVALVTGAGSGIGKATALRFAQVGAKVAAVGRTEDELQETVQEIERAGGTAIVAVADISDLGQMNAVVQKVIDHWQCLDIVVANAGVNGVWAPIEDLELDEWNSTLNINLTGTFITLKPCVPYLKKQGGSIVIVSSINGTRVFSNTGATAYAVTKAGQVALTKMLAVELGPFKVRVNVICPGAIETNINESTEKRNLEDVGVEAEYPEGDNPLTGMEQGKSEQVAELALFLASDAASHVNGTEIWIDGGQSLVRG